MRTVIVIPIDLTYHQSDKFWPDTPPIFPEGWPPTPEEIELARALFMELDAISQYWYCRNGRGPEIFADLPKKELPENTENFAIKHVNWGKAI
jgi:hypothetical protein